MNRITVVMINDVLAYNNMSYLQRKQIRLALGIAGASTIIFSLYQLYKLIVNSTSHHPTKKEETLTIPIISDHSQDEEEHIPYDDNIEDKHRDGMGKGIITYRDDLSDIDYRVILCLTKGTSYQGVVTISFQLHPLPREDDFSIDYNGAGVKFLMINGTRMDPRDVSYVDHGIKVPRELLRQGRNSVEVIFQNNYSFLNEGLSTYFSIDDNHKYSLRQQVVYSSNGYLQAQQIIPCLNCLNQCTLRLETIHPNAFEVFSNANKALERLCSITEYEKYPFLFDSSSNSLNRSHKLNASSLSSASGLADSVSSQYSSSHFYSRKKANTHFCPARIPSIHHLFLFSSPVIELLPAPTHSKVEEAVLLRYFCKHTDSHRLSRAVNRLHTYILDALRRLSPEDPASCGHKIDVIILADPTSEGQFAPGVILVSQHSLTDTLQIKCLYLVMRALLGLQQLTRGVNTVTLDQTLALNQLLCARFEEFRNYLYLKNLQHDHLRRAIINKEKREALAQQEGFFLKYFTKELRFIIRHSLAGSISFELNTLMHSFRPDAIQQFWENFLSNYNFLSPLIVEPLLKLAIRTHGTPNDQRLREQLKICFNSSKQALNFYSNQQISDSLPKFLQAETDGLEERLPGVKVKQKFQDFITQKYEKYLPVRSNIEEAQQIYLQFKKFNQHRNFHHHTIISSEIQRLLCFGSNTFIKSERAALQCSLAGWKLLKRLKIYPADEDYFRFMKDYDDLRDI